MKLDLQYLDHPGGGERLVILPETQYRILAQRGSRRAQGNRTAATAGAVLADGNIASNLRR